MKAYRRREFGKPSRRLKRVVEDQLPRPTWRISVCLLLCRPLYGCGDFFYSVTMSKFFSTLFHIRNRIGDMRYTVVLLSMIGIMLALSTAHWTADLVLLVRRINASPVSVNNSVENVITALARINVSRIERIYCFRVLN